MKTKEEEQRGRAALEAVAAQKNVPISKVLADCKEAIDVAWATSDPAAKRKQKIIFPEGKPSPEIFVARLGKLLRN